MVKKMKKVFNIVISSLLTLLLLCAGYLTFDKFVMGNKVPKIFGYGFVVLSLDAHSMTGTINAGDLVIIKECDVYEEGDIITYLEDTGNNTVMIVTHRIVKIKKNSDGSFTYITLGDANNNVYDTNPKIEIYGKVIDIHPQVGIFIKWFQVEGYLYFLGFLILIATGFIVFRKK